MEKLELCHKKKGRKVIKKIKKKIKKTIYIIIYMGNVFSKMCQILARPTRYYEKKKIQKIYDEVFQEDIWDSEIYPRELEI